MRIGGKKIPLTALANPWNETTLVLVFGLAPLEDEQDHGSRLKLI